VAKKRDDEEIVEAMIKVTNNPRTPAEREFAERIALLHDMWWYQLHNRDVSIAEGDKRDYAQFESELAQFAHLWSSSAGGKAPREGVAKRKALIEAHIRKRFKEKREPHAVTSGVVTKFGLSRKQAGRYVTPIAVELGLRKPAVRRKAKPAPE
jgi:hypothetical protein